MMQKKIIFLLLIFMSQSLFAATIKKKLFNPVEIPQIGLKANYYPMLFISPIGTPVTLKYKNIISGGVDLEIPLIKYLNSGFLFNVTYMNPQNVTTSSQGYRLRLRGERTVSMLIDLGFQLKPQVPIKIASGGMSLYLLSIFGLSAAAGDPITQQLTTSIIKEQPGQRTRVESFGVGFNTSLSVGVSYYPIAEIGLFVEGGYNFMMLSYKTESWIEKSDPYSPGRGSFTQPVSTPRFNIIGHGPMVALGIKIAT